MPDDERRVIVVEDDQSMREALERLLRAAGYVIVVFPTAEALLETKSLGGAGCLVLDVRLPGLSGFELRARLAEIGDTTPVIFISGYDEPRCRETAGGTRALAYLLKPFAGQQLLEAVGRAFAA